MSIRPRGPLPSWQPRDEFGRAVLADLQDRLARHQAEDTLPRSPRGLFYDLRPSGSGNGVRYVKHPEMRRTASGQLRRVNPMDASPDNVRDILAKARRAGLVDENWIDDGRAPDASVPFYDDETAEQMAASWVRAIRNPSLEYSPQTGQPVWLEVSCEAAGLIGRLSRVAAEYGVPVYSGGGYDGIKGKRDTGLRAARREVPTVVLQITDYDDHGLAIARASAEDSAAWAQHFDAPEGWLSFQRIALHRDQAQRAGLLDGDGNAEADGLPVPVMDATLREAIEARQDAGTREQTADRAADERARITGLVLAELNQGNRP